MREQVCITPPKMLVEMVGPNVSELVLPLRVVHGDRAVLDRLWDEEVPQGDVFFPRGVDAITGKTKR